MSDEPVEMPEGCVAFANQEVCVGADVEVEPFVRPGDARTTCVGPPIVDGCDCDGDSTDRPEHGGGEWLRHKGKCHFSVRQVICVTVPLFFDAKVDVDIAKVQCGIPKPGPCPK